MSLTLLSHQAREPVGKKSVADDSDPLLLLLHPSQAHHGQEPQDRHHRPVGLRHRSLQPCQVTAMGIMKMTLNIEFVQEEWAHGCGRLHNSRQERTRGIS